MKPLWKVEGLTEHHGTCLTCKSFVSLGFLFLSLCLCVSLCVSVCCVLCVCVVVVVVVVMVVEEGGREEKGRKRTMWLLIPAKVSLNIAQTEQLYQVKRMIGGIGDMLFSIHSQTENV